MQCLPNGSVTYWLAHAPPSGWTPSSFSSSRRQKAELMAQQPEDYMDDEVGANGSPAPSMQYIMGSPTPSAHVVRTGCLPAVWCVVCHPPLSVSVQDLGRYGIAPRRITATREFQVDPQGEVDELGRVLGKTPHTGREREASVLSDLFGDSFLKDIVRPARWGRC